MSNDLTTGAQDRRFTLLSNSTLQLQPMVPPAPAPSSPTQAMAPPTQTSVQTPTSQRLPLSFDLRAEGSGYIDFRRNLTSVEDRLFRPGMLLSWGITANFDMLKTLINPSLSLVGWRIPPAETLLDSGYTINAGGQFRQRARWQIALEAANNPFQLASYIGEFGLELGYQFANPNVTHALILRLFYLHHSNGAEEHCLFQPDTWRSRGISSCRVPTGSVDELRAQLNRESGDYASNSLGVSLLWRMWRHGSRPYALAGGISPEFQLVNTPEDGAIKNLSPEEADLYGHGRIPAFVQGELPWSVRTLRGEMGAEYHFGTDGRAPVGRFWAEAMLLWRNLAGFGFFLRLNVGRDFQHMFAIDDRFLLHGGVAVDNSTFARWMSMIR